MINIKILQSHIWTHVQKCFKSRKKKEIKTASNELAVGLIKIYFNFIGSEVATTTMSALRERRKIDPDLGEFNRDDLIMLGATYFTDFIVVDSKDLKSFYTVRFSPFR
jgi:hypothetical protein